MKNKFCITSPRNRQRKDIKEFITFIILAENHGYRMKSHGPIPMIKIGEKTILEKQIETIKSCFINYEIIVCAGFESFKINSHIKDGLFDKVRVVENQIHYNTNCCESIRLCLGNTNNSRIFIQQCNTILSRENYSQIDYNKNSIITQDTNSNSLFEISAINHNYKLQNLSLGLKDNYWIENFYICGDKEINKFYEIVSNINFKTKFLFEAINDFSRNYEVSVIKNLQKQVKKYNNLKSIKESV